MGSNPGPGSRAFLRGSGSSLVDPMALSLSVAVGGLKLIAKPINKANNVAGIRIGFIVIFACLYCLLRWVTNRTSEASRSNVGTVCRVFLTKN